MASIAAPTEAFIFDCDGTLADTMPAHFRAWQEVLRPHGIEFPEERFYGWGGVPTPEISRRLIEASGLAIDVGVLAKLKEQTFVDQIGEIVAIERVVRVARENHGRAPMAVASGGLRRVVEMTLRQIGVFELFPVIVAAEDTTRHKPEPDVFLEAARRLGVAPDICTVYEDTDLGVEAARRAGMRFVDVRRM
jgi:HAD superfamily hydrolase (TIGR01509 family)